MPSKLANPRKDAEPTRGGALGSVGILVEPPNRPEKQKKKPAEQAVSPG